MVGRPVLESTEDSFENVLLDSKAATLLSEDLIRRLLRSETGYFFAYYSGNILDLGDLYCDLILKPKLCPAILCLVVLHPRRGDMAFVLPSTWKFECWSRNNFFLLVLIGGLASGSVNNVF